MTNSSIHFTRRTAIKKIGLVGACSFLSFPAILQSKNSSGLSSGFETNPYLQNPSPTAMTIAWVSLSDKSVNWVEYGETPILGNKAFSKSHGLATWNKKANKIRLTGLQPGTKYYYKVWTKEVIKYLSNDKSFGMAVSGSLLSFETPKLNEDSVSMLVVNDLHERAISFTNLFAINQDPYDFVFLNGDIISEFEDRQRAVNSVINPCSSVFAKQIPFYFGKGNHETRGAHSFNFWDYFETPENQCYYSFTRGPVFFIVLDSGEDKEDSHEVAYGGLAFYDEYRIEQSQWLEKQLKSDERKTALYTVVLIHIPPAHAGTWHGPTQVKTWFTPLLNEYQVSLVISGHTHSYFYCQSCAEHRFPLLIGGGPENGKRTLIRVQASAQQLQATMYSDSGNIATQMTVVPTT